MSSVAGPMFFGLSLVSAACGGSATTNAHGKTAHGCPAAPFFLPSNPSVLTPVSVPASPTEAATSGAYRTLKTGESVVVAIGATDSEIVLARGVSDDDFAVSLYAHGPRPLQLLTVLGQQTYLYPGADLLGPDRDLIGRVPFAAGPDRASDACSRWELRATGGGLDVSQLAAYARALELAGRSQSGPNPTVQTTTSTTSPLAKALPTCQPSQLHLVSDPAGWHANQAAGGQFSETFTFTNISSRDCGLGGWPGLQAVVAGVPRSSSAIRVRQGGPSGPPWVAVTLVPGAAASFDIYGQDFDAAASKPCPAVTSGFVVVPPDDTAQMFVAAPEPDCGSFYVAPVIAGNVDRSAWSTEVPG